MKSEINKVLRIIFIGIFIMTNIPIGYVHSQGVLPEHTPPAIELLQSGVLFEAPTIKGLTVDLKNPFAFDFYIDQGDVEFDSDNAKNQVCILTVKA